MGWHCLALLPSPTWLWLLENKELHWKRRSKRQTPHLSENEHARDAEQEESKTKVSALISFRFAEIIF